MISAVDSSVLLDILTEDSRYLKGSVETLSSASKQGRVIISPIVIAEIFPLLGSQLQLEKFLGDLSIEFVDLGLQVSLLAGGIFMRYKRNKGGKNRVIADFLVGAHALVHAEALLTRDHGFYRPYFKDLTIIEPKSMRKD